MQGIMTFKEYVDMIVSSDSENENYYIFDDITTSYEEYIREQLEQDKTSI